MSTSTETIEQLANREYKYGFYTDVEAETIPKGLDEDVIRLISKKKNEPDWLLEWRLKAYRLWLTMKEPTWQNVKYDPINYQDIVYYSAPKKKKALNSLDEVDPEVLATGVERVRQPHLRCSSKSGTGVRCAYSKCARPEAPSVAAWSHPPARRVRSYRCRRIEAASVL